MKYNIRHGDYDPRRAIQLSRVPVDLRDEPPFLLVSRKLMAAKAGPLSKEFMHSVLSVCPAAERDQLKFTVRVDEDIRPGDAPRYTPSSWHTDYAHGFDNGRRLDLGPVLRCQFEDVAGHLVITQAGDCGHAYRSNR